MVHSRLLPVTTGLLFCCLIAAVGGCGSEMASEPTSSVDMSPEPALPVSEVAEGGGEAGVSGAPGPLMQSGNADPDNDGITRRIIYTADLVVRVKNLDDARKRVAELIETHGGYVASADIRGDSGSQRTGTWTIRIPVTAFDKFSGALQGLGYPERNSLSSQDVTDEFYDLQKRIENSQQEERRLLAYLEGSTEKLTDILEVEKELTRVRGEVERMQGRLQVLTKLSALTTVHLTLIERIDYQPPQAPTFTAMIGETFSDSVTALRSLGEGLVLLLVALVPWLPFFALGIWGTRRLLSRKRPSAPIFDKGT